jgi:hypothetical protein
LFTEPPAAQTHWYGAPVVGRYRALGGRQQVDLATPPCVFLAPHIAISSPEGVLDIRTQQHEVVLAVIVDDV